MRKKAAINLPIKKARTFWVELFRNVRRIS